MPDPRILAYRNAAAAYEKNRTVLQHLSERVQRAAKRLEDVKPVLEISRSGTPPEVVLLREDEWPSRDEINCSLKAVQDAGQALRDAKAALSQEEQDSLQGSPS
ncbi:MAG: hypothetical protein JWO38_354 [Gemmataceae bacterium]|nr:hypothetical protein [Gemmataceae bacterium]